MTARRMSDVEATGVRVAGSGIGGTTAAPVAPAANVGADSGIGGADAAARSALPQP